MLHDLFQGDDGGWLDDPALLDRLVTEKLQAEAETVAVEGWKWIEVAVDLPYGYGYSHGLRSLSCDPAPMTDEEEAVHTKRLSEYQALEEEHAGQDETPAEIDKRLRVSEAEMEKIEALPLVFNPTDIGRAGAFVTLDRYGALVAYRGYDHLTSDESIENGNTAYEYSYTETVRRFG
jgi:ParB family chromosome partitioning protein